MITTHFRFFRRSAEIIYLSIVLLTLSACQSAQGASGLEDPLHPELGNGGYDVKDYDLILDIDPPTNSLRAQVTIQAAATQRLERFNLDFVGLEVDALEINGAPAAFSQEGLELILTPAKPIEADSEFSVSIEYHGNPQTLISPILNERVGWFHFEDGTINVINWPDGSGSWLPGNHHPSDKATFNFEITVPEPWVVVAPGEDHGVQQINGETTFLFDMDVPMSSVSAVIYVDEYEMIETRGPGDVLIRSYVPENSPDEMPVPTHELAEFMDFFAGMFGEYPFDQYNIVILDSSFTLCQFKFANAEQTVAAHCPNFASLNSQLVAHELTHQWFGSSVTPEGFQDTWLAEGSATYAEWMWQSRDESEAYLDGVVGSFDEAYFASNPIASPEAETLLGDPTYWGGGFVLHALRKEVGDEVFFEILQTFLSEHQYSAASTEDFREVAGEVADRDLTVFFDSWLLEAEIPPLP